MTDKKELLIRFAASLTVDERQFLVDCFRALDNKNNAVEVMESQPQAVKKKYLLKSLPMDKTYEHRRTVTYLNKSVGLELLEVVKIMSNVRQGNEQDLYLDDVAAKELMEIKGIELQEGDE